VTATVSAERPADRSIEGIRTPRDPLRVASLPPPIPQNPYQRLLYDGLSREGAVLVESKNLGLGWLWRSRGEIDVLHFHWPEIYYRHRGASTPLALGLSWVRLGLFALRLLVARAAGYSVVWTVHQVRPHESPSPLLDRVGTFVLARAAHLLVAHDQPTADQAAEEFGQARRPRLVAHGSYVGVYPTGRSRAEVRAELGLPEDAFVLLSFGHLRRYKGLDLLLGAFSSTDDSLPDAQLVLAGLAVDGAEGEAVTAAAERDARVVPLLGFVPDERVAELFGAADVVVLPRGDGGTSGALILALSLGRPVVAADVPVYSELLGEPPAGWLFAPGEAEALGAAIRRAAEAPADELRDKGREALRRAGLLRWDESCRTFAELLHGIRS
jgi:beta-1,4-mannosyltransferase